MKLSANNLHRQTNKPSRKSQQKNTVEEFIFSVVLGYVAWNRTKTNLLHSEFLFILRTGMQTNFL